MLISPLLSLFVSSLTTTKMAANNIGFIGSGMMASSLMDGIVGQDLRKPSQMYCSDIWPPALQAASKKGYNANESNAEVCSNSDNAIFLAVKPNCILVRRLYIIYLHHMFVL